MKKLFKTLLLLAVSIGWTISANAQAPENAPDIMLQGFYYDSYEDKGYGRTKWTDMKSQAAEIAETFSMVWFPPSAAAGDGGGTGYHPKQWSNQASSWGSKLELKRYITALHEAGVSSNPTGHCYAIADIVINHRTGNGYLSFDNENFGDYGSFTLYEGDKKSSYVCCDDEASKEGYSCTGAKDAGYETNCEASGGYCAARDLDHSNEYIRKCIKAYLNWLKDANCVGYDGWRFDLTKGYLAKYVKEYVESANAYYSVGEFWDGSYDVLKNWINAAGKKSTTFDFALKYEALNNNLAYKNYAGMASGYGVPHGLAGADEMKRYSTTFVDNHDTFRDSNAFGGDWEQANAYIIAAPGIPCVFYPHWVKCKEAIKKMAATRYACGITNQSACSTAGTCSSYYKCTTTGTIGAKGTLICFIGSGWSAPQGYTLACSGNGWAYYANVSVPTGPVVTMSPNGGYVGPNGTVSLITNKGTIYYTTDGSTPTSSSTKYTAPITITTNNTVVKAISIDGSKQSSVVSGTFLTEKPQGITVLFKAPSSWSEVKAYAWTGEGKTSAEKPLGDWPGTVTTKSGEYFEIIVPTTESFSIIFSSGSQQTGNIEGVTQASCYDGSSLTYAQPWPVPPVCGETPTPTPGDSPYYVRINHKDDYQTTALGTVDFQGRTQYMASVYINKGDIVSTYDKKNDAEWTISVIDKYGEYNNFDIYEEAGSSKIVCNTSGCYNVYIKLKYEDDMQYFEEGSDCKTAVKETTENSVVVYPNPTTGELTVLGDFEFNTIVVTSLAGRVYELPMEGNKFNVSTLSSGMYLLELSDAYGNTAKTKFIKK